MEQFLSTIAQIALQHRIQKVILFGSRARGDANVKSDYDIAFISPSLTDETKNAILDQMEELDTFHKVDIVFLSNLTGNDLLTQNILKDGVTLMNKLEIKFNNFKNALSRLEESLSDFKAFENLSIRDGAIQRFEFTTELAWKTVREYLITENVTEINTPKSVMREAYVNNIITDEAGWLSILNDRNETSDIYDETEADEIFKRIQTKHVALFQALLAALSTFA